MGATSKAHALALISVLYALRNVAANSEYKCVALDGASRTVAASGEALLQTKRAVAQAQREPGDVEVVRGDSLRLDVNSSTALVADRGQTLESHKRNTSTFFYHYHIPRTGGTTVANLLLAHVCKPFQPQLPALGWDAKCTQVCDMGLLENEFVCTEQRREHEILGPEVTRVVALAIASGAQSTVFVTTLRRGSQRFISEWLKNVRLNDFIPPAGIAPISNESLQSYIQLSPYGPNVGPNLQVTYLTSLPPLEWYTHVMTHEDVSHAQQALLTGRWVIGFSDCMEQMNAKLAEVSGSLHGYTSLLYPKTVPRISQSDPEKMYYTEGLVASASEVDLINLDPNTKAVLDSYAAFDNELYDWAWEMASAGADDRFTGVC